MPGPDLADPAIDEIVAGKYRLTRLIGRGGMGSVWEGVHLTLGTKVAVKFIDSAFAESPEARQRFENEARAAARLASKYAVQVYDHGMTTDGRPFIVMEFLTGEPLDARLDRERRLAPADAARILSQVCRALSRAHSAGIVHRDLKPENIFLVWDEEDQAVVAKVVDFGIAKFTDNQIGISSSTRTGSVLGTPYYMSPEQARGLRSVDYRTDLWSLGVIAFRCVVGRLPFEGESLGDLLVKICTAPMPIPSSITPDVPAGFDAWFARALQREPADRFVTAQELAEQLMIVCGVSVGRPALSSGHLLDVGQQGPHGSGHAITDPSVPGVTAQNILETGGVFAKSQANQGIRQSTLIGVATAGLLVLGAIAGLVLWITSRNTNAGAVAQPSALSSAVAVSLPSTAVPLAPSSIGTAPNVALVEPTAAPSVQPVGVVSSAPAPISPGKPQAPAARPASPQGVPPARPERRGNSNRPIDLGY